MIGFISEDKNEVNYLKTDSEKVFSNNGFFLQLPEAKKIFPDHEKYYEYIELARITAKITLSD